MSLDKLWYLSRRLHRSGHPRLARLVKLVIFLAFRCVLPPEVEVHGSVQFLHHGLGVVLDPRILIIGPTTIAHGATIGTAGGSAPGPRVTLEQCFIGAGATVLAPRGRSIRIGVGAAVGANALVVSDVPDGQRRAAPEAVDVDLLGTRPRRGPRRL